MDEQRDESTSGANGLHFYARCAREAWRRSWDAANAWPPITALLVLTGGARLAGLDLRVPGDGEYGALIGTGLFILIAWLAVFLVQFVAAPPRQYARLEAERRMAPRPAPEPARLPAPQVAPILLPPTPPSRVTAPPPHLNGEESLPPTPRHALPALEVRLHDQVYETEAVDTAGERLPPSRAYVARVANRGDTPVRRCQLFFASPTHIQVVSGPFDLAPGAHRDLPVLRVIDESDEPHALLYFLDGETWAVAQGQAAWLPEPGRFKVKVLSATAPEASLEVRLAVSSGTPLAWTLLEAPEAETAPPEKAPKAGRKRRAWAAADAVVEPGAGD